jgi:hypothetical protein
MRAFLPPGLPSNWSLLLGDPSLSGALLIVTSDIPTAVKILIVRCIDSVEQLESLLLVRSDPARSWTAPQVAGKLYAQAESVDRRLLSLVKAGLIRLEPDGAGYRYAPDTESLDHTVGELAAAYRERKGRVIEVIFSKKDVQIQSIADAFRIKEEKETDSHG